MRIAVIVDVPKESLRCPVCKDAQKDIEFSEPPEWNKPMRARCDQGHEYVIPCLVLPGDYFIDFDTKINPGKLEATRVRIDNVTIADLNLKLDIALCEHPLYRNLRYYVKKNRG